jgi:DNA-binding MltR family transcriptional regulator
MATNTDSHGGIYDERDQELFELLNQQKTDSAVVILGAGILEDDLESLLRICCLQDARLVKKFVDPLFDVYAPFSTFSAKITVSYALGLIPADQHRALDLVRRLRNDVAHERKVVSFQSPKYESRLRAIVKSAKPITGVEDFAERAAHVFDNKEMARTVRVSKREFSDRLAFTFCVAHISSSIIGTRKARLLLQSKGIDPSKFLREANPDAPK